MKPTELQNTLVKHASNYTVRAREIDDAPGYTLPRKAAMMAELTTNLQGQLETMNLAVRKARRAAELSSREKLRPTRNLSGTSALIAELREQRALARLERILNAPSNQGRRRYEVLRQMLDEADEDTKHVIATEGPSLLLANDETEMIEAIVEDAAEALGVDVEGVKAELLKTQRQYDVVGANIASVQAALNRRTPLPIEDLIPLNEANLPDAE